MHLTSHNYHSSWKPVRRAVPKGVPGKGRGVLFSVLMACASIPRLP